MELKELLNKSKESLDAIKTKEPTINTTRYLRVSKGHVYLVIKLALPTQHHLIKGLTKSNASEKLSKYVSFEGKPIMQSYRERRGRHDEKRTTYELEHRLTPGVHLTLEEFAHIKERTLNPELSMRKIHRVTIEHNPRALV